MPVLSPTTIQRFHRYAERVTGRTIADIINTPLSETPKPKTVHVDKSVGRGSVLQDHFVTTEQLNEEIDTLNASKG